MSPLIVALRRDDGAVAADPMLAVSLAGGGHLERLVGLLSRARPGVRAAAHERDPVLRVTALGDSIGGHLRFLPRKRVGDELVLRGVGPLHSLANIRRGQAGEEEPEATAELVGKGAAPIGLEL